ncbi:hypothetical protein LNP24_07710 [Klebsiella pneumoniae subsp. pneumoniae]|nr:hypothetical protein [Klebsiella pneumoniae subsp. pneumoniae]
MTLHGDTRIDNYYWLRDDERARDLTCWSICTRRTLTASK